MNVEEFTTSMWNLLILVILEWASFILFMIVLQAKYKVPLMNQLGFTIEQYKYMIIPTMSVWFLVAVTTQIDHSGNDYTFRFAWIE